MSKCLILTSFFPGFHAFTPAKKQAMLSALNLHCDAVDINDNSVLSDTSMNNLLNYNVVVLYSAVLGKLDKKMVAAKFIEFLAQGGGILEIHYASTGEVPELSQIVGSRFRMHPAYTKYKVIPSEQSHEILENIEVFEIFDEMHQVYVDPLIPRTMLLYCLNNDSSSPPQISNHPPLDLYAKTSNVLVDFAWCHDFLDGRIVYSIPGHDEGTLLNPMYQKFISNSIRWLLKKNGN